MCRSFYRDWAKLFLWYRIYREFCASGLRQHAGNIDLNISTQFLDVELKEKTRPIWRWQWCWWWRPDAFSSFVIILEETVFAGSEQRQRSRVRRDNKIPDCGISDFISSFLPYKHWLQRTVHIVSVTPRQPYRCADILNCSGLTLISSLCF